jgi:AcrR family transcriptional regulator
MTEASGGRSDLERRRYEGAVAFKDLSARARIREAALEHFAEQGYDRATIRGIAQSAMVSPGLLRHHYGSKSALRKACDEYVLEMLPLVDGPGLEDLSGSASTRRPSNRFGPYVARSLADGSPSAGAIFDEMVTMTEQWLARADGSRPGPPPMDRRIRAALITAMALGVPLLHDHVSRAIGADMLEPEGEQLVALALLDIYSHPLLAGNAASAVAAAFDRNHGQPSA